MRPSLKAAGLLLCSVLLLASSPVGAAISVTDDGGRAVTLPHPARRIVSLAPHATELLFAAGAGGAVVGVSEYSNYPPEAQRLPSVGGVAALDLERVVALKPELVVVWGSGNSAVQIAKLRSIGIPVFESEPRSFAAIASSIERLALLAGTEAQGQRAASNFRTRLEGLGTNYRHRSPVSVFYQIWREPLMTLNGAHLVSKAIRLCGGENIFEAMPQLVPAVSVEAVLAANPEAIVASSGANDDAFAPWRHFLRLTAVTRGNLFSIDGELMNRAAPRILDGVEALCRQLDTARRKR